MNNNPDQGTTFDDPGEFKSTLEPGSRLIGIDGGTKTLGLALSDVNRTIASPLKTIRKQKFTIDVERLLAIANEHEIAGFVLGLPSNMDGTEGPRAQSTRAFAANLNKIDARPVLLWDERLSTVAAQRVLIDADTSRQRRARVIDKIAATVILQNALDRMNSPA